MVTEAIKPVLGEFYNYDSTVGLSPTVSAFPPNLACQNVLLALWRSFTQCVFVEDEGDIVFFKNQKGDAVRERGLEK